VPLEAGQLMKDDVGVEAEVELVLVGIRVVGVLTPIELLERTLDELLRRSGMPARRYLDCAVTIVVVDYTGSN